jgi:ribosomal protein RSM22 (predicted rRNA methylase)
MGAHLPPALKAALDRLVHGLSRHELSVRATAISEAYRSGGNSAVIRNADDALAYALARMPATYAAVAACIEQLSQQRTDFVPTSLLDIGAGPGTATWAAADAFSSIAGFIQLDSNAALRALALKLISGSERFAASRYDSADIRKGFSAAVTADLVIASYVLGEIPENDRPHIVQSMWGATNDTLLIVEPGTPAGYARVIDLRQRLIAAGGHVIAPCPHDRACPLSSPDWCHFTQRLARSRDHKQVKGVELPFEDEKFSYVALTRVPITNRPAGRVLAQPTVTKIEVAAKLCMPNGDWVISKIPRRDKDSYMSAKRWRWGDAVS